MKRVKRIEGKGVAWAALGEGRFVLVGWREIWTLLQVSERFGFRRALWDWRRGEDGNSTLLGWSV